MRRADVEEGDLVGAFPVIGAGLLHRVACIAERDEVHALDDAAVLHVEAGDDAECEHGSTCRAKGGCAAAAREVRALAAECAGGQAQEVDMMLDTMVGYGSGIGTGRENAIGMRAFQTIHAFFLF